MKTIIDLWNKIPAKLQTWLKGLEVAVVSGVISALLAAPSADFSTKAGWAKFLATVGAVIGGCVRLYLTQSPLQNVITATEKKSVVTDGNVAVTTTETNVVTGPPAS